MLSDHDALFAAILARPDDDLARLVFADFLEESGHPAKVARAAYIRTQIAAATESDPAEQLRLTRAAAELRAHFRDEADALLGATPYLMAFRRRGFVDELRGGMNVLHALAAELFEVAPVAALHVESFDADPGSDADAADVAWMNAAPYLRSVRRLKIGPGAWDRVYSEDSLSTAEIETVLHCRHLRNLAALDLSRNDLADDWLLWFVPRLPVTPVGRSLRRLDLSGNSFGEAAASLLGAARGLDALELLDLTGNRFGSGAQAALRARFGGRVRG